MASKALSRVSVAITLSILGFGLVAISLLHGQRIELEISEAENSARAVFIPRFIPAKSPPSIPTVSFRGLHSIPVNLNGISSNFLVDTGAAITFVSKDIAQKAGVILLPGKKFAIQTIAERRKVPIGTAPFILVGETIFRDFPVIVFASEFGAEGVLGMDILGHFKMILDNQAKTLTLIRHPSVK